MDSAEWSYRALAVLITLTIAVVIFSTTFSPPTTSLRTETCWLTDDLVNLPIPDSNGSVDFSFIAQSRIEFNGGITMYVPEEFAIVRGEKAYEIGFRDDGVVVWRPRK